MKQRTKNIVLIIGFILVVLLAYKYAISNTLELRKTHKTLKSEADINDKLPLQLTTLKQKEKYYDSILSEYQLAGVSVQNGLLKTINHFAKQNNIKVLDFIEPHVNIGEDSVVKTYQFDLEGDYNAISQLLYRLEQKTKFGEIITVDFEKKKNHRTSKNYLTASILLRSFE